MFSSALAACVALIVKTAQPLPGRHDVGPTIMAVCAARPPSGRVETSTSRPHRRVVLGLGAPGARIRDVAQLRDARAIRNTVRLTPWYSLSTSGKPGLVSAVTVAPTIVPIVNECDDPTAVPDEARLILGACTQPGELYSTRPLQPLELAKVGGDQPRALSAALRAALPDLGVRTRGITFGDPVARQFDEDHFEVILPIVNPTPGILWGLVSRSGTLLAHVGGPSQTPGDETLQVLAPSISYARLDGGGSWILALVQRSYGDGSELVAHSTVLDARGSVVVDDYTIWMHGG